MNSSTINSSNIKIHGYQTGLLSIVVSYNPVTKTAIIDPAQDFKYGEQMSITLTDRIKTSGDTSISSFFSHSGFRQLAELVFLQKHLF